MQLKRAVNHHYTLDLPNFTYQKPSYGWSESPSNILSKSGHFIMQTNIYSYTHTYMQMILNLYTEF